MGKTMLQFKVQCQRIVRRGPSLSLDPKMGQGQIGWLGSRRDPHRHVMVKRRREKLSLHLIAR